MCVVANGWKGSVRADAGSVNPSGSSTRSLAVDALSKAPAKCVWALNGLVATCKQAEDTASDLSHCVYSQSPFGRKFNVHDGPTYNDKTTVKVSRLLKDLHIEISWRSLNDVNVRCGMSREIGTP